MYHPLPEPRKLFTGTAGVSPAGYGESFVVQRMSFGNALTGKAVDVLSSA